MLEVIDTSRYDVAPITDDATAREFVTEHHYSGTYPATRRRIGLYRGGDLVGVAVYSVPVNSRTITNVIDVDSNDAVELGPNLGRLDLARLESHVRIQQRLVTGCGAPYGHEPFTKGEVTMTSRTENVKTRSRPRPR